jgi:LuxR family transcriptional regulator, maltose regulon positive regulatory protein
VAPAVQRRAAAWCERSGLPEDALEYSIAAEDVGTAARLVEQLWLPAYWAGRSGTLERWVRWLNQRDGIRAHPMIAVMAGFLFTVTGRPVEAKRWAGLIDHWQYEDPGWAGDPATEAFAATLRVVHCRHGVKQMRADLDEAARKYAIAGIVTPTPAVYRGIACILAGEPGNADAFFREAASVAEQTDARRSWWARCANGRCWRWPAATGARPRTWLTRPAPLSAGPGSKKRSGSGSRKPASPRTGEISPPPARRSPAPSGSGP